MSATITPYRVHQCSKCTGDIKYFCVSCPCVLCPRCEVRHIRDLKTIDHNVVIYREKFKYIPKQEFCLTHPSNIYRKYCDYCQVPVCDSCSEHKFHRFQNFLFKPGTHKILNIERAYSTQRKQYSETIHTIKSEDLFYKPALLKRIKVDVKTCLNKFSLYQSEMVTKAHNIKERINFVLNDLMFNVFCDFNFKHRCLKHKLEISIHLVSMQKYEYNYEMSAKSPIKFLLYKKTAIQKIHHKLHTSQLCMTKLLNKEDVMELLRGIQITERGNRLVGNERQLKLMLHQSLTLRGVYGCYHISGMTSDRVWVSDEKSNLIMANTTGDTLHHLKDLYSGYGLHTVNSEGELIYIDKNHKLKKMSKDMKPTTTFIEITDSTWEPRCVYWSPSTGDLLVGMYNYDTKTGKVTRYNQSGQLTQIIQRNDIGFKLYSEPNYITENNNGDVVVSDSYSAVVVTRREGRHRFSYTGHPSGSGIEPHGICTDALSRILVCDYRTSTIQVLDRDGNFLSPIRLNPSVILRPCSLCYDVNSHRLWVGSWWNNKVCVYRCIT